MHQPVMSALEHCFFALPIQQALSATISYRQYQQLTLLVIDEAQWRAVFSLQGAQLLIWRAKDQANHLWLSEQSAFQPGKAIRGGIPLCWPWFGDAAQPNHGFARLSDWQLSHWQQQPQNVHFRFQLNNNAASQALWPHQFTLWLDCQLSAYQCQLQLYAQGDFSYTTALHSYFTISDVANIELAGLGNDYLDKVTNQTIINGESTLQGLTGQTDRIYRQPAAQNVIIDRQYQRKITIQSENCSDLVLWNPGITLAQQMSDISPSDVHQFVCLESARIHQTVDARHPQTLACHIQVHPIN